MIRRAHSRHIVFVTPLAMLVLSACAQATYGVSPGTILSTVILAGEAIGAAGGSSGSRSGSTRARIPRSPSASASASRVLSTADRYVGVPYVWGGNTPQGFDCSGFTKYVFRSQGVDLPRTARDQARAGDGVALDFGAMRPGDMIFFAERGEAISHVAIYVGNGQMIHASSAAGRVGYLDLNGNRAEWYLQNMVAVRRVIW